MLKDQPWVMQWVQVRFHVEGHSVKSLKLGYARIRRWKDPAGQGWHGEGPVPRVGTIPAAQTSQLPVSIERYFPGGHAGHDII